MAEVDDPQRAQLESRLRFEALVADLSSEFVNLQPALIDGAIADALRRLVEALDVDRGVLTELSDDNNTPEKALIAAEAALLRARVRGVQVTVAAQGQPTGPMRIGAATVPLRPQRRRLPAPRPVPLTFAPATQLALF